MFNAIDIVNCNNFSIGLLCRVYWQSFFSYHLCLTKSMVNDISVNMADEVYVDSNVFSYYCY